MSQGDSTSLQRASNVDWRQKEGLEEVQRQFSSLTDFLNGFEKTTSDRLARLEATVGAMEAKTDLVSRKVASLKAATDSATVGS
ncbi:hypothetical protein DIPPA_22222 [Diplonema papillatum]|nr:hypothetical protein DIPPA_22222 [Diplonema papillatum]